MKALNVQAGRHIGACVLCVAIGFRYAWILEGSEFSGGSVTGPLLTLHSLSGVLFLLSAAAIVFYPRVAIALSALAAMSAVPLYANFIVPGVFRAVFHMEASVPSRTVFVWDWFALAGTAAACATVFTSLTASRFSGKRRTQRP